jgi:hypothetical protein
VTGARQAAREKARNRSAAVRAAKAPSFTAAPSLTRFYVRAPAEVIHQLLAIGGEAIGHGRHWHSQGTGPIDESLSFTCFFANDADAERVRAVLREHGISEVSE